MTHTPGPWNAVRSATCGHLRAAHNHRQDPREEWTDADIALLNAAPDLLAALETVLYFADGGEVSYGQLDKARAIVAKAKGASDA